MFRLLKPGPNPSLTCIYPSINHPNMVGCSDDCSDTNSEQKGHFSGTSMQVKKSSKPKGLLLNKVHQFKPRLCTL